MNTNIETVQQRNDGMAEDWNNGENGMVGAGNGGEVPLKPSGLPEKGLLSPTLSSTGGEGEVAEPSVARVLDSLDGSSVDGNVLLNELMEVLRRFVVLPA